MKVGDLVELSATGRNLTYYKRLKGQHGIVIERIHGSHYLSFRVHWCGKNYDRAVVIARPYLKLLKRKVCAN